MKKNGKKKMKTKTKTKTYRTIEKDGKKKEKKLEHCCTQHIKKKKERENRHF